MQLKQRTHKAFCKNEHRLNARAKNSSDCVMQARLKIGQFPTYEKGGRVQTLCHKEASKFE